MTPQDAIQLGTFLRQKRKELGLSQRELARRAGITDVVRIEQGALLSPRTDTLRAIAGVLGLTLSDLLAIANYVEPEELPTLSPYLRAKYGDMPEEALREVDQFLTRLRRKHGIRAPVDHEDER